MAEFRATVISPKRMTSDEVDIWFSAFETSLDLLELGGYLDNLKNHPKFRPQLYRLLTLVGFYNIGEAITIVVNDARDKFRREW
jgi:hypothetical protein